MKNLKQILVRYLLGLFLIFIENIYATHIIDVMNDYGAINAQTLQSAADDAMTYRKQNNNTDVVIKLAEGTFRLNEEIDFTKFNQSGTGWIILQGAGRDKTRLIDTEYALEKSYTFNFKSPYKFEISDMTLEGERLTHSQGTIVSINQSKINITLDEGFPTPNEMYEVETTKANKIRRILDSDLHPVAHYIEDPNDNDHQSQRWTFEGSYDGTGPSLVSGRTWRFYLHETKNPHPFKIGDRVGVSSKSKRSNWAVFTGGGRDIRIKNIDFLKLGRVKFRGEWHNIHIVNNRILRPYVNGKPAFYSTDAGPQIGHEKDGVDIYNLVFENNDIRGTVDDSSAFQRIASGSIKNNYWEDGGGVPLGESCSNNITIKNNTFYHSPLEDLRPGKVDFKGAYKPHILTENNFHTGLSWSSGSRSNHHEIRFGTQNPPKTVVDNQTQNQYIFDCTLQKNTTYYWQVFEHNTEDSLGMNKSDIWFFTTGNNVKNNGKECISTLPDYTLALINGKAIFTQRGTSDLLARISEINDISSMEKNLSFDIFKNNNFTLSFDPKEKKRKGVDVENKLWSFSETSTSYRITYKDKFPKKARSYVGLLVHITTEDNLNRKIVIAGSISDITKETNSKNNKDSETIRYNNITP